MDKYSFTPAQHALLFAWIAEAVIQRVGLDIGQTVIRKGIQRYGEQRGYRMALRALTEGQPLSMVSFLSFGEWRAEPEAMARTVVQDHTEVVMRVSMCPWNSAWLENGLQAYGRLYCLEIDAALVRGFNTGLKLSVNETLSNGNKQCVFVFQDAVLAEVNPGKGRIMPWSYHVGHLYKTMGEVIEEELGSNAGSALAAALAAFRNRFGDSAARVITASTGTDFNHLVDE